MADKTNIAVMALGHLKVNLGITDIDTDTSNEADIISIYLDEAVNMMLEDKKPPWAENYADLGLVLENPNSLWGYSYRYPTDCAVSLDIVESGKAGKSFVDGGEVVYRLGSDASGKLIYTDYGPTATLRYIRKLDVAGGVGWRYEDMPGSWAVALSYLLASLATGSLSSTVNSDAMLRKYEYFVSKALAASLNEQGYDVLPESAAARAR